MKTKNIVMASILLVVAIVIGSLVATYFSYNNREIALRQQAEAQRGKRARRSFAYVKPPSWATPIAPALEPPTSVIRPRH